jgi:hypothetical protein
MNDNKSPGNETTDARSVVLEGPLTSLSDSAVEQIEYLAGRAVEADLSDLDVIQELFEEFSDAIEYAGADLESRPEVLSAVLEVEKALRAPDLGDDVNALRNDPAWELVRVRAQAALAALAAEGLIDDSVAYRLLPVRFATVLEPIFGPSDEWLSIVLTYKELDWFTSAWHKAIPIEIPVADVDAQRIREAVTTVYAQYPEFIDALGLGTPAPKRTLRQRLFGGRSGS